MASAPDDMPHQFARHIDPDNVTMGQLYSLILQMRQEQKDTTRELAEVRTEFKAYKDSQKDMLETWSTAKGVLSFLKLLAALGIGVTFIWGLFQAKP
jgi:hypothetical protein